MLVAAAGHSRPGECEFKQFQEEFETAANIRGEVHLIIAASKAFFALLLDNLSRLCYNTS